MGDFFRALSDPSIPFIRNAFLAGMLSSVAFGIIGTHVVVRRISSIAGAIAHSVLAGIGFSLFLQSRGLFPWLSPLIGAILTAIAASIVIGIVSIRAGQREDTIIGAIWAVGMATGLLFISITPGYVDPMSYLFGNILLISRSDLYIIGLLDVAIVAVCVLFFRQLQASAYDEEFARARGLNNSLNFILLLILVAVTVVLMVSIVGIVMVIALLTLPAAVASIFSRNLWQMMLYSCVFTVLFTSVGMATSYSLDLPSGSMIIVVAGGFYLIATVARWGYGALQRRKS